MIFVFVDVLLDTQNVTSGLFFMPKFHLDCQIIVDRSVSCFLFSQNSWHYCYKVQKGDLKAAFIDKVAQN